MPETDLEELEEVARQTAYNVNEHAHTGRGHGAGAKVGALSLPSNLLRASLSVARPKVRPDQQPDPTSAPAKAVETIQASVSTEVTSYNEALGPIRERVGAVLKIRYEDFDHLCGFAAGLSGKIFGQSQVKHLGVAKFFDAIRATGLRIRLEED